MTNELWKIIISDAQIYGTIPWQSPRHRERVLTLKMVKFVYILYMSLVDWKARHSKTHKVMLFPFPITHNDDHDHQAGRKGGRRRPGREYSGGIL